MSKVPGTCLLAAAAIGIALYGADAAAETAPVPAAAVPADVQPADVASARAADTVAPAAAPSDGLMGVEPIAAEQLAGRRGGTEVHNDMLTQGYVGENQAVNVTTGANFISEGSFAGAAGLPMVVQNTGNNVLIQNSTILNIQVK